MTAGLGDGGDASQGSLVTPGAALHVDVKNPFEQPCPTVRRAGTTSYAVNATA
jgi:hypothetical protein